MKRILIVLSALLLTCLDVQAQSQNALTIDNFEVLPNFHAAGVSVNVSGDANKDASMTMRVRLAGGQWQEAHPLVRLNGQPTFAGSLFNLAPNRRYEVEVTASDPNGVRGSAGFTTDFTTRNDQPVQPSGRTYHVATTGSNNADGFSQATALATIQEAATRVEPGDLILVQPGIYREQVRITLTASTSAPVVIRAAGPGTILDGANKEIAGGVSWRSVGNGVFARDIDFETHLVVTDRGRLMRYTSRSALESLAGGQPGGFYFDGSTVFVKFANNTSPENHAMHVSELENGFFVDGATQIRIEGFEVRHFGAKGFGKGIYFRVCHFCVAVNNQVHDNGLAGVWIKGGARALVERNTIWDTSIINWKPDLVRQSGHVTTGVLLTDEAGPGHVVRNNTIFGTFNGIGGCGDVSPPRPHRRVAEVDIYNNDLSMHADDAIEPEGWCANVRIWGNRVEDSHHGISIAPARIGPIFIVRNTIHDIGTTRADTQASPINMRSGFADAVGPTFLYHNTFVTSAPETAGLALLSPGSATSMVARNNVYSGTNHAFWKLNRVALDADYNAYHTTHQRRFINWEDRIYSSLDALRSGEGQESFGVSGDPKLVEPAGGNFTPGNGSPLVDQGQFIAGVTGEFKGNGPDIGAVESSLSATPPNDDGGDDGGGDDGGDDGGGDGDDGSSGGGSKSLSGLWYSPDQSGHGFAVQQLRSNDQDRLLAYWFVHLNGEQVWLGGVGDLNNGRATVPLQIAGGTGFPPAFDGNDVVLEDWGSATFVASSSGLNVSWSSPMAGFGSGQLDLVRLTQPSTSGPGACLNGAWYQSDNPGHGLLVEVVDGPTVVVTWFAYAGGEQAWLQGTGDFSEDGTSMSLLLPSGSNFPPDFEADEISLLDWGDLTLNQPGPNRLRIEWSSELPGFSTSSLTLDRLTMPTGVEC